MHLSLIAENDHPELAGLVSKIKGDRGGRFTYPYSLLLHSPAIAEAWLEQVTAVRWKTMLDDPTREMVIIRVAMLTRVDFVKTVHASVYAPKAGLTQEQISGMEKWRDSKVFSESQKAVLAYVDAMTVYIQVPDAVQEELQRHFSERQIIELTVLIGTYNMHTRVFQALEIERRSAIDKGDPPSATRASHLKQ